MSLVDVLNTLRHNYIVYNKWIGHFQSFGAWSLTLKVKVMTHESQHWEFFEADLFFITSFFKCNNYGPEKGGGGWRWAAHVLQSNSKNITVTDN